MMLHITNGDSAAELIAASGVGGEVLAWRDVLHEGPVSARLALPEMSEVRAEFIAACGWGAGEDVLAEFVERDFRLSCFGEHEEVVLWFEHDLYDQLQLLQILTWFEQIIFDAGTIDTRVSLINLGEHEEVAQFHGLGELNPAQIAALFPAREAVTKEQLALAADAWAAFGASDPAGVQELLDEDTSALPFLHEALRRHLQQFPSNDNGLSLSEQFLLETVAAAAAADDDAGRAPLAVFAAVQQREAAPYMSDAVFFDLYVAPLCADREPLLSVRTEAGEASGEFARMNAATDASRAEFNHQRLHLTDAGRAVLAGEADHLELNGIDLWRGGVRLHRDEYVWRWDEASQRLV